MQPLTCDNDAASDLGQQADRYRGAEQSYTCRADVNHQEVRTAWFASCAFPAWKSHVPSAEPVAGGRAPEGVKWGSRSHAERAAGAARSLGVGAPRTESAEEVCVSRSRTTVHRSAAVRVRTQPLPADRAGAFRFARLTLPRRARERQNFEDATAIGSGWRIKSEWLLSFLFSRMAAQTRTRVYVSRSVAGSVFWRDNGKVQRHEGL
ncbi:hypothetical protein ACFL5O_05290 [Myxococcota bacterium]